MDKQILIDKIAQHFTDAKVSVSGEGCNLSTVVITPDFKNKSLLARQKMILSLVKDEINSGELHALSIKARTPEEV